MSEFEMPEGQYPAALIETQMGKSSQKETPYMKLICEIEKGYRPHVFLWITPKTMEPGGMTHRALTYLGFNGDFDERGFDESVFEMGGVTLDLKYEEYEGKSRPRWELMTFTALPQDKLKQMAQTYRGMFQAAKKPPTAATRTPPTRKPPAKPEGPKNGEECFEKFARFLPDLNDEEINAKWTQATMQVETESGIDYSKFGPEQWYETLKIVEPAL